MLAPTINFKRPRRGYSHFTRKRAIIECKGGLQGNNKVYYRGWRTRHPAKKRTYTTKQPISLSFWAKKNACVLRSRTSAGWAKRTSGSARPLGRCGIWLGVLVVFLLGCNIPSASHRDFKPYPFVALLLGFVSDRRRERLTPSTKLRLRALPCAQDDRLIVYFAIIVRF